MRFKATRFEYLFCLHNYVLISARRNEPLSAHCPASDAADGGRRLYHIIAKVK